MAELLFVFTLDDVRFALPLTSVSRVLRMPGITPLPDAPAVVLGVIDIGGRIVPVADLRPRFGLPARSPGLDDQLVLAQTRRRALAVPVDVAIGVVTCEAAVVTRGVAILQGLRYIDGVARLPDGLVLIHDLDTLLSLDEGARLDAALPASPRS